MEVKRLNRILAEKIIEFRKLKGLTQEQLAERAGFSLSMIQKIESGKIWPRLETIEALSKVLGVNQLNLLVEGEVPPVTIVKHQPAPITDRFDEIMDSLHKMNPILLRVIEGMAQEMSNKMSKKQIEELKIKDEVIQRLSDELKNLPDRAIPTSLNKARAELFDAIVWLDDSQLPRVRAALEVFVSRSKIAKTRMQQKVTNGPVKPSKVGRGKGSAE